MTMALVALAMVGIIAMAGLSIDIGTLYQASAEAQRAADAAALAAARTISMQGLTGDPNNVSASWQLICGGPSGGLATPAANTVVTQNPISGASTSPVVTVTYSYSGNTSSPGGDCSAWAGTAFGVNPLVTVLVQQSNLPTYFSRIWGRTGNTVSATATAEAFNPSGSGTSPAGMVPVQPRCVKPWIVPNYDPLHPGGCSGTGGTGCSSLVGQTTGTIFSPGLATLTIGGNSVAGGGVIGERFWLMPDCTNPGTGSACTPRGAPEANFPKGTDITVPPTPNLEYLPGQVPSALTAIPACASSAPYAEAIAGCDQSTQYQCGVQSSSLGPNFVDLSENPGLTDTTTGVQCLIHQTISSTTLTSGQDVLLPPGTSFGSEPPYYPFQIQAGTSSLLTSAVGSVITSSNSIASLPIYDSSAGTVFTAGATTPVTIIGFLQVFINVVDQYGNMYVTVLNVSGCGNGTTPVSSTPLYGTSPVPVRLITPTVPSS